MSAFLWILGLAVGAGVAVASSGGDEAETLDYKGFAIQVAPTELGTWAFAVRAPGREHPIAIGVYTDRDAATTMAKAWIDETFPGGPDTVPLGYGEDGHDDDGTDPEAVDVRPEDVDQVDDDGTDPEAPRPPIPTPTSSSAELPPNYQVMRDATAL